jgi:arginyl-tRNA synthetase
MEVKDKLKNILSKIAGELGGEFELVVEFPSDMKYGDLTTNAAMVLGKMLKRNPMEAAEEIARELRAKELGFVQKIEVVRPGFVNFWLSNEYLLQEVGGLIDGIKFPDIGKGKTVVVEYSSPNIAKPFTIGHLRSTIIGDAAANLLKAIKWDVRRDNHVGDWGTQFGKQIAAIKSIPLNKEFEVRQIGFKNEELIDGFERPIKLLVKLYVDFHDTLEKKPELEDKAREWFKKLEDGDPEARRLWKKCIEWSWKEFDVIYKRLGISFSENGGRGYGESYFEHKMPPVVKELEEKHLLRESDGAKLVFFPEDKFSPLMIVKKDGATLYSTRDLATDKFRLEKYGREIIIINEVGVEQSLYFQQLYEVEQMLGWFKEGQRVHVKHGHYRFKDQKMSTRKGNVIWLEDVLTDAIINARKLSKDGDQDVAEKVGIGALKWNDLKRDSKQDIVFDWGDVLNMQGNSGPYMQYTYARTQSVLRKSPSFAKVSKGKQSLKLELEERELMRLLARFEDVVREAGEKYAPSVLCNYLFDLAQAFNLFYQKLPILKAEENERDFRLRITEATGTVIKSGLNLLGIEAPEKM